MYRSKLKNNFNKNPTKMSKGLYKMQWNYYVNLLKEKKKYYNIELDVFANNKKVCQSIKPLFSAKQNSPRTNIVIIEGGIVTFDNKEVLEKLNNYFIDSVRNLDIESFIPDCMSADSNDVDPDREMDYIDNILMKYKKHPSIVKIKENIIINNKLDFIGRRN